MHVVHFLLHGNCTVTMVLGVTRLDLFAYDILVCIHWLMLMTKTFLTLKNWYLVIIIFTISKQEGADALVVVTGGAKLHNIYIKQHTS